jgi:hypothetical protein
MERLIAWMNRMSARLEARAAKMRARTAARSELYAYYNSLATADILASKIAVYSPRETYKRIDSLVKISMAKYDKLVAEGKNPRTGEAQ